jgi:hypothetical protein
LGELNHLLGQRLRLPIKQLFSRESGAVASASRPASRVTAAAAGKWPASRLFVFTFIFSVRAGNPFEVLLLITPYPPELFVLVTHKHFVLGVSCLHALRHPKHFVLIAPGLRDLAPKLFVLVAPRGFGRHRFSSISALSVTAEPAGRDNNSLTHVK